MFNIYIKYNLYYAMPETKARIYIMSDYKSFNNVNRFAQLPEVNIQRSKFDRSHTNKICFNSGLLVPFFCDEVLPGDTMDLDFSMIARLTTAVAPAMDNIHIDTFFFFVPNRLVWDHWQAFCGEQRDPDDSTDYVVPKVVSANPRDVDDIANSSEWFGFSKETSGSVFGSLWDYFGIAPFSSGSAHGVYKVNAMPFRAYNLIWNEWFRDQNLQKRAFEVRYDTDRSSAYYNLLPRAKRHDYFTSSLPWPQFGPGADLPLSGGTLPVFGNGKAMNFQVANAYNPALPGDMMGYLNFDTGTMVMTGESATGFTVGSTSLDAGVPLGSAADVRTFGQWTTVGLTQNPSDSGLVADASAIGSVSINDLRTAFALQRWMETAARGGHRYREILRAFFGVDSPDARLQVPEYLGGSTDYINLHQVAQNSATDSTSPQGHLAAYGYHSSVTRGFTKSFVEHGYIIGLVNVWTDVSYQQGINRMWLRNTKLDYYWPQTAHLGEQVVYNCEIFADPASSAMDIQPFGYQERHAEYRYHPNMICGLLRSQSNNGLDFWHFAEKFDNQPALNSEFIIQNSAPLDRLLAVQNQPEVYLDTFFDYKCTRPMPLYGTPGLDRL